MLLWRVHGDGTMLMSRSSLSVTDSGMSATSSIAICNMKAWPFTLVACLPVALRSAMFHTALHFCILRKPGEHISEEVLL